MKTWVVTGGAGFIGSNFVLAGRRRRLARIINIDKLTYAGNAANLTELSQDPDHLLVKGDVADREQVERLFSEYHPDAVIHLAAESHVDRSIVAPGAFVETNIKGTFQLLEGARRYLEQIGEQRRTTFRFLHVSTDEVYGSLGPDDPAFSETSPYSPNSPYAASKAAADHLVRAYRETYGLPAMVTNCSNNYGPFQFPEKLIPLMILNALEGRALPIYGDGLNVRDWLYVEDHCRALQLVLEKGKVGETYNIGGKSEKTNREVVDRLCETLDKLCPESPHRPHRGLIQFVKDRPGHDRRYAIDCSKIERELGWKPLENFESGLEKTIRWYLENHDWVRSVQTGEYRRWIEVNYAGRG